MASVVRGVLKSIREKGLASFLRDLCKEGYTKCIFDGNLLENSGEGDEYIYHFKGHALNPGQRDWTRYHPWQPVKADTQ